MEEEDDLVLITYLFLLGFVFCSCVISYLSNFNILVRFCRFPHLRTAYNTLVLNIAISDMVKTTTLIIIIFLFFVVKLSPKSAVPCEVYNALLSGTTGVSVYTMVILAAYHYWATRRLLNGHQHKTRFRSNLWTIGAILLSWALPTVLSYPPTIIGENCEWDIRKKPLRTLLVFLEYVTIPLLIVVTFYFLKKSVLRKHKLLYNEDLTKQKSLSNGTALLLVAIFVCQVPLVVCSLAFVYTDLMTALTDNKFLSLVVYIVLCCIEVWIKPFMLYVINLDYVFCCCVERCETIGEEESPKESLYHKKRPQQEIFS